MNELLILGLILMTVGVINAPVKTDAGRILKKEIEREDS
jgi:hypothetical protein